MVFTTYLSNKACHQNHVVIVTLLLFRRFLHEAEMRSMESDVKKGVALIQNLICAPKVAAEAVGIHYSKLRRAIAATENFRPIGLLARLDTLMCSTNKKKKHFLHLLRAIGLLGIVQLLMSLLTRFFFFLFLVFSKFEVQSISQITCILFFSLLFINLLCFGCF